MHEKLMNWMLSNTCHSDKDENGLITFKVGLDLHCKDVVLVVKAKQLHQDGDTDYRYEIVSFDPQPMPEGWKE